MEHPTAEILLRFSLATASRQESRQVVRHLLARCPACAAVLKGLLAPPVDPGVYDQALDRLAARGAGIVISGRPARPRSSSG